MLVVSTPLQGFAGNRHEYDANSYFTVRCIGKVH